MNPIPEGWKCPSCYLIHSPFKDSCDCIVLRTHDSRAPLTLHESLAAREVRDAWERLDAAIAKKTTSADQWTPEQLADFARP